MKPAIDRDRAVETLRKAVERGQLERTRVVPALDALATTEPGDAEVAAAVIAFGEAMLAGVFGERVQIDVLERCLRLLARGEHRQALPFYRAAVGLHVPTPRGDLACTVRAVALVAIHALEPRESRYLAAALLGGRADSGEPARSALAVLGAAGEDVAILLACNTVLAGDVPLTVAALEQLTADVPAAAFWTVAAPVVGDRFSDAVLAITDIIVGGRRSDLVPGFGEALVEVSDPNLMRAVLLALGSAHLDGLDAVFTAVVERAPRRALEAVADALEMTRIATQEKLLQRVQQRLRGEER